jgi:hypothetical protein
MNSFLSFRAFRGSLRRNFTLAPLMAITLGVLLPGIARADLAAELAAPGDTPQMRGLGVGGHFGRMPNWDIDKLIPLMKQMGVQYVRDEWGWEGVEKSKGVYAMPPEGQHKFDALNAAGIKIICALDYGNKLYKNPLDPDAFANYAAWMAKTYKGKVAAWEIWNEPDNFYFFKQYGGHRDGSDDAIWNAKYSELVGKATTAIKAADPAAVVIHNNEGTSWKFALQYHASDYAKTDGVDIHPYPTNPPKDGVEGRTPELDTNSNTWPTQSLGHRVQCWVGECGMSTYTPKDPAKVHFTPVTDDFQAACEVRTVLQGLVYGVKAWCIYDFVDETADPHDVESNFGLIRDYTHHYEPKPAFYSLQRLAKLLGPDWRYQETMKGESAVLVHRSAPPNAADQKTEYPLWYWFRVGNDEVTIVWKAGKPDFSSPPDLGDIVWPAPKGATAEAVDLVTGKSVPVKLSSDAKSAKLSGVPVGWAPVAIRWALPAGSVPATP